MRRCLRMFLTVSLLLSEYDLRRFDSAGTGHFTAFALTAQKNPFVLRFFSFRTEPLGVRSCLLRSGKIWINPENRTVFHANRAAYAVFIIHWIDTPCRIAPQRCLLPAPDRDRNRFSVFECGREFRRIQRYFSKENWRDAKMNP